ncbi:hypothetical protein Glove_109g271 [Diversispora epigaea]|uniref:Uncharacterized protein n=1 Tax=Diversispora epigaea TaxID=1348612 RepID=A0A397J2H6_9GLOM|nr:hypothetical protein Glove_109g271 [Diversispora epigaea]
MNFETKSTRNGLEKFPRKAYKRAGAEKHNSCTSTLNKVNQTAGTNTVNMELSLTKENLLNQDKTVEVNPDTNNNTENNTKGKGKQVEDNATDINTTGGNDVRVETDDIELSGSKQQSRENLKEKIDSIREMHAKIEVEGTQGNNRLTLTRAATNQKRTNNNENGVKFWAGTGIQEHD